MQDFAQEAAQLRFKQEIQKMIEWNMAYAKQVYEIDHKHKKRLKTERDQKLKQKEVLKNALEN